MKTRLPTIFQFDDSEVKVVYLQGDDRPYYNATTIAQALELKNASNSALSAVDTLAERLKCYCELTGTPFITDVPVQIANSVRSACILASDGLITIIKVAKSNRATSHYYYYYNQEALYEILLNSSADKALRFRHWITHNVLPAIAKTGEYIAHRKDGIAMRRTLTDAIKLGIDNKELKDTAYAGVTDAVYFIRYGVHTDRLRVVLGVKDGENIREKLDQDELDVLARLESDIAGGINLGMPLEQILTSARLIKIYRRSLL